MAGGASTALTLIDRISGPLTKMMSAMEQTITIMERMDSTANSIDTAGIQRARSEILSATVELQHMGSVSEDVAGQQENLNNRIRDGTMGMKGYATSILSAVGAYKALNAAKNFLGNLFSQGIDFHIFKQGSEVAFTTFLGDAETAKTYMDDMLTFAKTTPFAFPDLIESSRNLIAFGIEAENTFPIMQSIGDAVAGIGGGNAELQNMADIFGMIQVQGKITMMEVNRLGKNGVNAIKMLSEAAGVTAAEMKKQISAGAIGSGEAITALVAGMDEQFGGLMAGVKGTFVGSIDSMKSAARNAGADMMEEFMVAEGPLVNLVGNITNLIKKIPTYIGPAVAAFLPLIMVLNETLDTGAFDRFFSAVGAGLATLAWVVSGLGMSVLNVAQFFGSHWAIIEPILIPIATTLAVITAILIAKYTWLGLVRTATLAWAAAQWVVNAAYLANPIGLTILIIVGSIALVIYAMVQWAEQTAVVIGFIVGSIYWLGAAFYNVLMGIGNLVTTIVEWFVNTWNLGTYAVQMGFIGFNTTIWLILDAIGNAAVKTAEWFANTWNDGVFGVQTAFYKMASFVLTTMSGVASGVTGTVNKALGAISDLINGAISGINSFIGLLNGVLGTDLSTIGTVDLKMSDGASKIFDKMQSNLTAPVKAERANFGVVNNASRYVNNVEEPAAPIKKAYDRLEYTSLGDAFDRGNAAGTSLALKASDKISGVIEKVTGLVKGGTGVDSPPDPGDYPMGDLASLVDNMEGVDKLAKTKNPTGGKLDSVGKIEKDINLSDEDIKMMRDLAEIKSIQQTITLTPTITFGDMTIREDADVKKIIYAVEKYVEEEMTRSAEGVYT